MVCVSALLTIPLILSNELCPGKDLYDIRVKLISSTFVVSGISTIIQTLFGTRFLFFVKLKTLWGLVSDIVNSVIKLNNCRLALLQGTDFAYVPSIQVFMQLPDYICNSTEFDYVPPYQYENKMAIVSL